MTEIDDLLGAAAKQKTAADEHLKNAQADVEKAKEEVRVTERKVGELTDLKQQEARLTREAESSAAG